jgi:hypothetical protein
VIRNRSAITPGQQEAVELPGVAPLHLRNQAEEYARENYPTEKKKYAGLIIRLASKGKAQDPRYRGDQSKKYGIPLADMFDIEQQMLDIMFPKEIAQRREHESASVRLADMAEVQRSAIRAHGGRKAFVMEDNKTRIVKATKGEHRGKFIKITANGVVNPMSDKDAQKEIDAAGAFHRAKAEKERTNPRRWVHTPIINSAGKRDVRSELLPLAQWEKQKQHIRETHEAQDEQRKAIKEARIKIAQQWAESMGYDAEDSYWWGYYWNDPSLVKSQNVEGLASSVLGQRGSHVPGTAPVTDPNILSAEHPTPRERRKGRVVSIPAAEASQKEMRGHRPGPRRDVYARDDVEGEDELKQMLKEIRIEAERATRKSKKSSRARRKVQKRDAFGYIAKTEVTISKLPRDVKGHVYHFKHGWIPLDHPAAGEAKIGRRVSGVWDHNKGSVAEGVKLKRLAHGAVNQPTGPDGKKISRKNMTPEKALYLRNNGKTAITDKRLAEIHKDRSKITPQERDLLMSAGAQEHLDGNKPIKVYVVRDRSEKPRPRFSIIANLRKEIANDLFRAEKKAQKGKGGHIVRRSDISDVTRSQENEKRVASGRNIFGTKKGRAEVAALFSENGRSCKCIFCGREVENRSISPERLKPGPLGGVYEISNVAPAHEDCNTKHGALADSRPNDYLEEMMRKFTLRYGKMLRDGKLKAHQRKHRKYLGQAAMAESRNRRKAA